MANSSRGEIRWLRFHFTTLAGVDKPTPIDVFEDTQPPANGFTILLHIERLDAHLTMLVRARGTTDDIIHNVQWEKTLFTKLASVPSAAELVDKSKRFVDENARPSESPKFLESTATALDRAAGSMAERNRRIGATYAALRSGARSGASSALLQKLHRDFLLEVQRLTE